MAYDDLVTALPSLQGYWKLNDAAGSMTLADSGANTLTLTCSAASVQGAEIVSGLGASLQSQASWRAFRTSGSVTALRAQPEFTLAGWYQGPKASSGSVGLFGAYGWASLAMNTTGFKCRFSNGGSLAEFNAQKTYPASNLVFVALRRRKSGAEILINGVPVTYGYWASAPTVASDFELFAYNGNTSLVPVGGLLSGVFQAGAPLGDDELQAMAASNTYLTAPVQTTERDGQDVEPYILRSAAAGRSAIGGGDLRALTPKVVANGRTYRAGDYALLGAQAQTLTSSSTPEQVGTEMFRFVSEQLGHWIYRAASWDNRYFGTDGADTNQLFRFKDLTVGVNDANYREVMGLMPLLATQSHMAKLRPGHLWNRIIKRQLDHYVSALDADYNTGTNGVVGYSGNATIFCPADMAECILLTRDRQSATDVATWTTTFLANTLRLWQGHGAATAESIWYTNGNYEIFELQAYWLAYRLTGLQVWRDRYEYQLAWLVYPAQNQGFGAARGLRSTTGTNRPLITTQNPWTRASDGSLTYSAPTTDSWYGLADTETWTSTQAYLTETNGTSAITGSPWGLDWGYSSLQLTGLSRLYAWNRDVRVLRIINGILNTFINQEVSAGVPRLNQTTWAVAGTGGSRTNSSFILHPSATACAIWGGGRTDIADGVEKNAAAWINEFFTQGRDNTYYPYMRDFGAASALLMLAPQYPGHPR